MRQERFSNLTILNCHKERKARLSLVVIANELFDRNSNRKRDFGIFKESDTENINLLPHLGLYRLVIISIRLDYYIFSIFLSSHVYVLWFPSI